MLALVALLAPVLCCAVGTNTSVTVDPSAAGLPFDGNGGLSAGASSRLLFVPHALKEVNLFCSNWSQTVHFVE